MIALLGACSTMLNFYLIFQSTTFRVFALNQDVEFVTQLSVGKTITSWLKDAQGLAIFIVMICARRHNGRKQSGFIQQFQLVSLLDLFLAVIALACVVTYLYW